MNTEFGSAALARNVDDDVYDFSGVADPKDREMLIRTEQRLCRSYPYPPATFEEVALMCKTVKGTIFFPCPFHSHASSNSWS
jgi:hypothetical protein